MAYFRTHPETGVTDSSQVAVVGDRLTTDMMLANMMGGWGFWVRDGVVPLQQKSMVSVTATWTFWSLNLSNPRGCSFHEWSETSLRFFRREA